MVVQYNYRLVGHSIDRLAALSDGVFAVAMTLLVLDLKVPGPTAADDGQRPSWDSGALDSESVILHALRHFGPSILAYFLSFLILGIFWIGQQAQLNQFKAINRDLTWIHLFFLFFVSTMPFSTALLAEFSQFRLAVGVYWLNQFILAGLLLTSLTYADRADLLKADMSSHIVSAVRHRIIRYQAMYAVAASLSLINTYLSLGVFLLVQVNSAIGPKLRLLSRL